MRTHGWMAGYHDSFDEMGEPLHEMVHNVEGFGTVSELYAEDMEMLRELGL